MREKMTRVVLWMTALALVVSGALSVLFSRQQEISAARESLTDMLAILDAQRQITDVEELIQQFSIAAPDRRLTLVAPDGTVLADTVVEAPENHADRTSLFYQKRYSNNQNLSTHITRSRKSCPGISRRNNS